MSIDNSPTGIITLEWIEDSYGEAIVENIQKIIKETGIRFEDIPQEEIGNIIDMLRKPSRAKAEKEAERKDMISFNSP